MLYLASRPRPSAIFHVVHERMQYFNWFVVFPNFCAVLELMCRVLCVSSAFWKWNSGRRISPSLLRPWIWDFEYEYNPDFDLGMGDWISDGDNDDSDDFSRDCSSTGAAKRLLDSASSAFFLGNLRLRCWRFEEGQAIRSLLALSLRSVRSPCRTAGYRCRRR